METDLTEVKKNDWGLQLLVFFTRTGTIKEQRMKNWLLVLWLFVISVHTINASDSASCVWAKNTNTGGNVTQQLKVRVFHKNGSAVDCYLDDVAETSEARFIISDAKHSQKTAIVDGQIPGYTTNQTQGYQWIVDGNLTKIEVIGDKGARLGIIKGDDLLPRLKGKIIILTNNSTGQIVESSVFKTN